MSDMESRRVLVIGAGPGGSALALLLARRGCQVTVLERRGDIRKEPESITGRSINLALSKRGISALARGGLDAKVLDELAIPMYGRQMHDKRGNEKFQQYGVNPSDCIYSASRRKLNEYLLDALDELPNAKLVFGARCLSIHPDVPSATVRYDNGDEETLQADLLVGADGARSAVRTALARLPAARFSFSQSYITHGYKEFHIAPAEDGSHRLSANALHIWPRHDLMLIALPNTDGSFTVTLFAPFQGERSFESLERGGVREFFKAEFPDVLALLGDVDESFHMSKTGPLVTVRCEKYNFKSTVMLLGDAAHAVVPFYGQGMNAALEDATVFDELVDKFGWDMDKVLQEYSAIRAPSCSALADLALHNYVEMRSSVVRPSYILRRFLDRALHAVLGDRWLPLYSMVTFTRMPLDHVVAARDAQDRAVRNGVRFTALAGIAGGVWWWWNSQK